ncbi:MAG TPA: phytanoyl-CoA dioxygenase family protein [Acidimicrobiales bacterium]|nr:phytanoyl-CoA dioxygenase family protein [Acidimicrobiales bacterium]
MSVLESLDRRTRSEADISDVEAGKFFEEQFPKLAAENGALAARGAHHLDLRPLTIDVDGLRWTLRVEGDETVAVPAGAEDDGSLLWKLQPKQFSDWVQELRTVTGFFTARDTHMRHGRIEEFLGWECVLRALTEGRPVYEAGSVRFTTPDGDDLDLRRSFGPGDDPAEIAWFLRQAGFLHLRGWLDPAAMASVDADISTALPTYEPDDGRSWWATLDDGSRRAVRLQNFVEHSPTTAAILHGERWAGLRQALDPALVQPPVEGNVIEALVKPIGVSKGLSDLPWHRDCSLGSHPYTCAGVTVGISVTDSDHNSGQLRVVAGSHRASVPAIGTYMDLDLPVVPLPTRSGDLTVHLSCTLHEAVPPVTRERRVMYSGFSQPPRGDGSARGYNANLREQAPILQDQPPNAARERG